jgi:hypothetical protein
LEGNGVSLIIHIWKCGDNLIFPKIKEAKLDSGWNESIYLHK